MTSPIPETNTYVLQNPGGTGGTMNPIGKSVYIPVKQGVANVIMSWTGGYDVSAYYTPTRSTSDAYIVASFTGVVESQTESFEIPVEVSTGYFYIRSGSVVSGNADKPLGLMVTVWPIY